MKTNHLLTRIKENNFTNLYYNTACLKVSPDHSFDEVYSELLEFVKETNKEEGCIEFFAAPSSIENKEVMLWEVWENEAALDNHMKEKHTQDILSKNLIELQWNHAVNMSN